MDWAFLKKWWERSLWARGPVAAIALVSIVLPLLGIEVRTFLEFTNAIVTNWNYWNAIPFRWIEALIPLEVHWDKMERNYLIIFASLIVPTFLKLSDQESRENSTHEIIQRLDGRFVHWVAIAVCISGAAMIFLSAFFETDPSDSWLLPITVAYAVVTAYFAHKKLFWAFVFGLGFIAMIELLYLTSFLEDWMASIVEQSKTLPESD